MNIEPLSIPVVIPAYQPDEKLTALVHDLCEAGFTHIVIVDDGSGEKSRLLFEDIEKIYPCTLMHHHVNQGKGRALKTAFDYVRRALPESPGCITADADGQHSPDCIRSIAQEMVRKPDALILGVRSFEGGDVPKKSEFGNKLTRRVMKYLSGVAVSDTQTGLRGIPASFMERLLSVKGERYEFETNMLLETKKAGVPIVEVPIRTIYIDGNSASHFHPVRDSVRIYLMFGKFIFSSLSASVIDLALFTLLCFLLRDASASLPGPLSGVPYITAATVLARILSALFNYLMNQRVVFESDASMKRTFPKYVALALVQMCLSAFLVSHIHPLVGGLELFTKIPVDLVLFFASYFVQREVVYK